MLYLTKDPSIKTVMQLGPGQIFSFAIFCLDVAHFKRDAFKILEKQTFN